MEQITEYLIQKTPDKLDFLKKTAVVFAAFFGTVFVMFISANIAALSSMGIFLAAVVMFVAYKYAQTTDVEFEYCIVNGDIDIDRIFDKKRRKRYVEASADRIEKILPVESEELKAVKVKKTYFAAKSKKDETNYAILFKGKTGLEKIIITDDEKVLLHFLMVMPKKVQKRA